MRKITTAGFTLVEMMIVVAILAIVSAIAIPTYQGYIEAARVGTMRHNMETMRVYIEDFRLDSGSYGTASSGLNTSAIGNRFGWTPDGDDQERYNYTVIVTATPSYNILVEDSQSTSWARCGGRTNCCSSLESGATKTACP